MFTSAGLRTSWRPGRSSEPSRWLAHLPSTSTLSTWLRSTIGLGSCANATAERDRCPNRWRRPWPRCAKDWAAGGWARCSPASRCTPFSRPTRPRQGAVRWSQPSVVWGSSCAGSRIRGRPRASAASPCAGSPKRSTLFGEPVSCARRRSRRWTRSARRWPFSMKRCFVSCRRSIASSIARSAHRMPACALPSRPRSYASAAGLGAIAMATIR